MKKIVLVLLALVLVFAIVGCKGKEGAAAKGEKTLNFTYVTPLIAHPVWNPAGEGFMAAGKEFGFNASYVGPQGIDPAEMVNQIEIALASGADGIATMPIAPEAMRPVFKKCADAGVPVVFAGAVDPQSVSIADVGTDEATVGKMGAEGLIKKFDGKPIKAHILMSTMDASFAMKSRDAYLDNLKNYAGGFEAVLIEPCNSDMMVAMERYQNALTAHPEINCLIGVCGEAGPAAAKVVKEMGKKDIVIMAIDDTAECLDFVRDGTIYGTVAQNFYKIGYEPGKILYEYVALGKKPTQKAIDSGCMLVTKDNIDTYVDSLKN